MTTATRPRSKKESELPPPKVEDNTLDEQHAGISEVELPITDNDQSTEEGQSHVATVSGDDRERRAYSRAERREFVPTRSNDWLSNIKGRSVGEPGCDFMPRFGLRAGFKGLDARFGTDVRRPGEDSRP